MMITCKAMERMFLVTVAILLLCSYCRSFSAESRSCDERATYPNLKQDYLNWLEANGSLHDNPAYQQILHIFNDIGKESAFQYNSSTSRRGYLQGNRSCTNSIDATSDLIRERSTCPWHQQTNVDENRYPKSLITVKCTCNKCLDLEHEEQPKNVTTFIRNKDKKKKGERKNKKRTSKRQTNDEPRCQEIYYMQKVLTQVFSSSDAFANNQTRVCVNNTFLYVPTYERISIGCTCASQQNKRNFISNQQRRP